MENRFVKINEEYHEVCYGTLYFLKDLFKINNIKSTPLLNNNKEWFGYDLVYHKKNDNFYTAESRNWY